MNAPRRQPRKGDMALMLLSPTSAGARWSGSVVNVLSDPEPLPTASLSCVIDRPTLAEVKAATGGQPISTPDGIHVYCVARCLYPIDKGDPDAAVDLARYGKIKEVPL